MITFDEAPENVRKLSFAIMESLGPTGIPEISPRVAIANARRAGLNAAELIAAIRWMTKMYESGISKRGDNRLAKLAVKHMEAFAVTIEEEAKRENARARSCDFTI